MRESTEYSENIEDIALEAAEMPEFIDVVKNASGRAGALKEVRILLPKHFPEISELPEPKAPNTPMASPGMRGRLLEGSPSNDFMIAKNIVDLLS